MKSEKDILKMTEPEWICWLKASRVTLMFVGIVWIGMIGQQLFTANLPWFLIAMVPVFALTRFAVYKYYKKRISS